MLPVPTDDDVKVTMTYTFESKGHVTVTLAATAICGPDTDGVFSTLAICLDGARNAYNDSVSQRLT